MFDDRLIRGFFFAGFFLLGCVAGYSLRNDLHQQQVISSHTLARIRTVKTLTELRASLRKEAGGADLAGGATLYSNAQIAHDKLITNLISGLLASSADSDSDTINALIDEANLRREIFETWAKGEVEVNGSGQMKASASPAVLVDVAIQLLQLQASLQAEEREAIRTELRDSRWRSWDEL